MPKLSRPKKILAAIDTNDAATTLKSAADLADTYGAALEVLTCVEPPHDLAILARLCGQEPGQLMEDAAELALQETRAQISATLPDRAVDLHVQVGKAFVEIILHVAKSECDFVIKTAEPLTGVHRYLLASTDQHLLRKCPCPVWLQTPSAATTPRRVLATVDLDVCDSPEPETLAALNQRVIEAACGVATAPNAEVIVLHAWEAIGEGLVWAFSGGRDARISADRYVNEILKAREHAMRDLLGKFTDITKSGTRLTPRLARGAPQVVIDDQRRQLNADVVVMGTVARTGMSGVFIGNTAENIINTLDCPVLAVKPEGFVSPLL